MIIDYKTHVKSGHFTGSSLPQPCVPPATSGLCNKNRILWLLLSTSHWHSFLLLYVQDFKATHCGWVIWSGYFDGETEALWGKWLAWASHSLGLSWDRRPGLWNCWPSATHLPRLCHSCPWDLRQVLSPLWASVSSSINHFELGELEGSFWIWQLQDPLSLSVSPMNC